MIGAGQETRDIELAEQIVLGVKQSSMIVYRQTTAGCAIQIDVRGGK
jgi:hypothetical protein